jgi:rhombotail lipoprotein
MNSPHRTRLPLRRLLLPVVVTALALSLAGCVGRWGQRRHHESSSVVQFLYPDQALPYVRPEIPTLRLPLRVGVAFVPPGLPGSRGPSPIQANFTEQQKTELMRQVAGQFKALPFVQSIEIIPATYLRPGGGFTNLDQLRAMLGIDVIALIAYDQAQNSSDTEASLAYWTIVGAYLVEGQRHATHTLMEAAVYDIPSRSLLFRAPGTSTIQNHATLVRNDHELRQSSAAGIAQAAAQMTASLAQELERFKVRAREEPSLVKIERKPGYTGGGALDAGCGLVLLTLLGTAAVRAVRSKASDARK